MGDTLWKTQNLYVLNVQVKYTKQNNKSNKLEAVYLLHNMILLC